MERQPDWLEVAERSILLEAVSQWRDDPENWFHGSFDRLPETVRINPLRKEVNWIEEWLKGVGARKIDWFKGSGGAWRLPFQRGKASDKERNILKALHQTGRITRQEEVSMVPVLALDPKPGEIILDICASPGSKTTQISENLANKGVVIANEVMSQRSNTLVSNVKRHASRNAIVVQHDGRYIPKIPEEGFDRVLVDVPCSGSGTTRKNPELWEKWSPSAGHSLHDLQHALLSRAIQVTKPGGRIVYSTCSLDPIENEAVVARSLLKGQVSIINGKDLLPDLPSSPGMSKWPMLDDLGKPSPNSDFPETFSPPHDKRTASELKHCVRIWNDTIDGGGFFLCVLEKNPNQANSSSAENKSNSIISSPADPLSFPRPIQEEWERKIRESWGNIPPSMWIRGKNLIWSTEESLRIWRSQRFRRGSIYSGECWRPLKVIHLGLIVARTKNGEIERILSRALPSLCKSLDLPIHHVDSAFINRILSGEKIFSEEIFGKTEDSPGSRLLSDREGILLPVWVGSIITPMISESEAIFLRAMRDLSIASEEE